MDLSKRKGSPPTLHELAALSGTSKANCQRYVRILISRGYLKREGRSLSVIRDDRGEQVRIEFVSDADEIIESRELNRLREIEQLASKLASVMSRKTSGASGR